MSENKSRVDSSPDDDLTSTTKTVIHSRSVSDQVRNAIRIGFLILLWPIVVISFVFIGVSANAGLGDPQVSRFLGKLGFYAVVGTGTICALHAKKSKWIRFFWGALGAFIGAVLVSFLVGIIKQATGG